MYKIIACDLDETLLSTDGSICSRNITNIRKATELGVKFVLATGRGYITTGRTLEILGLNNKAGEYVLSFNGGAITENRGMKLLHFEALPFEIAEELYRRGQNYRVGMHVYTKDKVYAYKPTPKEFEYVRGRIELTTVEYTDLDFLKGQEIAKCLYMNTDRKYLQQIERDFSDIAPLVDISYSSNRYLEFNKRGVNKGAGLMKLAEMLGVDPKETIAIGDNFNDLPMIKAAGLGVGVKNTVEDMKPMCDIITDSTNNEGAVGEVIEKYILNA